MSRNRYNFEKICFLLELATLLIGGVRHTAVCDRRCAHLNSTAVRRTTLRLVLPPPPPVATYIIIIIATEGRRLRCLVWGWTCGVLYMYIYNIIYRMVCFLHSLFQKVFFCFEKKKKKYLLHNSKSLVQGLKTL